MNIVVCVKNKHDISLHAAVMLYLLVVAVILDTNIWYHSTKIIGKDMSITIGSEYD